MSILAEFTRVSGSRRCPVCDRLDWCLIERGDHPRKVVCARVESPRPWGEAGWLHILRDDGAWRTMRRVRTVFAPSMPVPLDLQTCTVQYQEAVDPPSLNRLARVLGVTANSLRRLDIGWSGRAWTFPMRNAAGIVTGVRLRFPDGTKMAVKGGKEGLFVPRGLGAGARLLIAEGPTDTAALLDLGFDAIGRPSCTGGTRVIVRWVQQHLPTSIVICGDADGAGIRGASSLASALSVYCRSVCIITPPHPHKDAREWLAAGATPGEVIAAVEMAPNRAITFTTRRVSR